MKKVLGAIIASMVLAGAASAQSVIVNEFSQGSAGNAEWIELLVVTDATDMRGWELGDNDDGGFTSLVTFTTDAAWASVEQGTIIVVYNGDDIDATVTSAGAPDVDFSDNVVLIPHSNTTFFTDETGGWGGTGAFANSDGDDTPAIRDASDTMVHDMAGAHPTADVAAPGSGSAKGFVGDSVAEVGDNANWSSYASGSATPGAGNGGDNTLWVASLLGVTVTPQLTGAYSIDGDTVRVVFDVTPGTAPVAGDFTFTDSQSAATISAVNATAETNVFDLDLSAALTDTSVDTIDYTANSAAQSFVGGISDVADIRSATIAVGSIVTVSGSIVGTDGVDDAALQQTGVAAANSGLILRGSAVADVSLNDDAVIAGEVATFTDGGGSTRIQLSNMTIISAAAGTPVTPTVLTSTDFLANNTAGANPAEQYEGVLIQINDLEVTTVAAGAFSPDFGISSLEDASSNIVNVDDTFYAYFSDDADFTVGNVVDVVGVGWETFGEYVIAPRADADIEADLSSVTDWHLMK